jgi:hypothetical protein
MKLAPTLITKETITQEVYSVETSEGTFIYTEYVNDAGHVLDFVLRHPLGYDVTTDVTKAILLEEIQNNLS